MPINYDKYIRCNTCFLFVTHTTLCARMSFWGLVPEEPAPRSSDAYVEDAKIDAMLLKRRLTAKMREYDRKISDEEAKIQQFNREGNARGSKLAFTSLQMHRATKATLESQIATCDIELLNMDKASNLKNINEFNSTVNRAFSALNREISVKSMQSTADSMNKNMQKLNTKTELLTNVNAQIMDNMMATYAGDESTDASIDAEYAEYMEQKKAENELKMQADMVLLSTTTAAAEQPVKKDAFELALEKYLPQ